jgi:Nucleotidyl transferase AbiEii toxin, Type IV TA system
MPMVYAEKLVTAVARGTANTRWRDFGDVYVLSGIHPVTVDALRAAISTVAAHRGVSLAPLKVVLDGYEAIAQSRYAAWRRRHRRDELPAVFADLLSAVINFADPVLAGHLTEATWEPERRAWR